MKFRSTILLAAAATIAFSAGSLRAQNTSSQTVQEGATIAQPLVLTNYGGLFFGAIMESANTSNVTASITGTSGSSSQGFTETYGTGAQGYTGGNLTYTKASIAGFTVTGEPSMSYTISYPSTTTITSGSNSMTVDSFNPVAETVNGVTPSGHLNGLSSETTATSNCGNNGGDAWCIGGRLLLGVNQPSGTYTGTFTVTITYN